MEPLVDAADRGRRLYGAIRIGTLITAVGCVLGLLMLFLMSWTKAFDVSTASNVITFMLLWLIPSVVITWGVNRLIVETMQSLFRVARMTDGRRDVGIAPYGHSAGYQPIGHLIRPLRGHLPLKGKAERKRFLLPSGGFPCIISLFRAFLP